MGKGKDNELLKNYIQITVNQRRMYLHQNEKIFS